MSFDNLDKDSAKPTSDTASENNDHEDIRRCIVDIIDL